MVTPIQRAEDRNQKTEGIHHKGTKINTKFTKKTEFKLEEREEKSSEERQKTKFTQGTKGTKPGAVFCDFSRLGLLCELCFLCVLLSFELFSLCFLVWCLLGELCVDLCAFVVNAFVFSLLHGSARGSTS
jgi:hypothetical protein